MARVRAAQISVSAVISSAVTSVNPTSVIAAELSRRKAATTAPPRPLAGEPFSEAADELASTRRELHSVCSRASFAGSRSVRPTPASPAQVVPRGVADTRSIACARLGKWECFEMGTANKTTPPLQQNSGAAQIRGCAAAPSKPNSLAQVPPASASVSAALRLSAAHASNRRHISWYPPSAVTFGCFGKSLRSTRAG